LLKSAAWNLQQKIVDDMVNISGAHYPTASLASGLSLKAGRQLFQMTKQ